MNNKKKSFDPLSFITGKQLSPDLAMSRTKREIMNVIKSYVGTFDVFAESIQNALDAIETRNREEIKNGNSKWEGKIKIEVDCDRQEISISDNGVGFTESDFKTFVAPNFSYKSPSDRTRGNKGVGATYLAFGFDHFEVRTKSPNFTFSGRLINGRTWLEDKDNLIERPKIMEDGKEFNFDERGTTIVIRLGGLNSRPKDLKYWQAQTADQWGDLLRCTTPLGHLGEELKNISGKVKVIFNSDESESKVKCSYPFAHQFIGNALNIDDYIVWKKSSNGLEETPPRFKKKPAVYKNFLRDELVDLFESESDKEQIKSFNAWAYIIFTHSTSIWDLINDSEIGLRKGYKILKGGFLMATDGMIQGEYKVIPLTSNIGYQKQCHIVIHLSNVEPDLGRKGFQPEINFLCEKISTKLVTELKAYRPFLKPNTNTKSIDDLRKKRHEWITEQEDFSNKNPLILKSPHFFKPKNEISIISVPQKEQDVVALFNQLIAGGVIHSIELMATSQNQQYDGIFRFVKTNDKKLYLYDKDSNPLGIPAEEIKEFKSEPRILEFKYNLNDLMTDFRNEEKDSSQIDLAICWKIGSTWKEEFGCISYLLEDHLQHREYHGITHRLTDSAHSKISVICLSDLIDYLNDPIATQPKQSQYHA